MDHVDERLVRRDQRLIQLFDPPFDKSALEPGYIKGYAPGVRENGGQYTHGAIWAVMAFAELGETERAWELFWLLNPIRHTPVLTEVTVIGSSRTSSSPTSTLAGRTPVVAAGPGTRVQRVGCIA